MDTEAWQAYSPWDCRQSDRTNLLSTHTAGLQGSRGYVLSKTHSGAAAGPCLGRVGGQV